MVANAPAIMQAEPKPRRNRDEDAAHKRRMRRGGQALLAAAAAIPAAGAVSAEEAAFHQFTGPQAYVTQVQDTDGDTPATEATQAPTPGQIGGVCLSVPGTDGAVGALLLVTPDRSMAIGVDPNVAGSVPDDCISREQFTEDVRTRMTSFVHDTSDYMQEIATRAGISPGPAAALKNPGLTANPVAAWQRTAQQFSALNQLIARRVGPEAYQEIIDSARSDALIERHQQMGAELSMIGVMAQSLPTVQEQLENGSLSVGDEQVIFGQGAEDAPDADAIPIRFESGPNSPHAAEMRQAAVLVDAPKPAPAPTMDRRRQLTA